MAALQYFGTLEDAWAILADFFARPDLRAYVDESPYERPGAPVWFNVLSDMLKGRVQARPRLYLVGDYSTHPLLPDRQVGGPDDGKYFLTENGGGPAVHWSVARESPAIKGLLISGQLTTQPQYQLAPGRWEKPSAELKAAYEDLVKRMKRHLVRQGKLWIGQDALQRLQAGTAHLPESLQAQLAPARPKARRAPSSSTPPAPPVPKAAQGG